METILNKKIIFIALASFLLGAGFCSAQEKKYFRNEELQSIIKDPFYLYNEKKNQDFPLNIEDFSTEESILIKDSLYSSEIESPFFCREAIKNLSLCEITDSLSTAAHSKKVGKIYLEQDKINAYLNEIAKKINSDPVNGKLEVGENGDIRVLALSRDGKQLDIEESCNNIKNALISNPHEKYILLKVNTIEPEIKSDQIAEMGIVKKIGEGESNFAGSPNNRIHNIKVAVARFHGLIIDQDEEFSFIQHLGEVDEEHGYLLELVIKNNETKPEFGGGICQVSTTMFRAALNTGLKITARQNHAYPVQYYAPQGTDATVYIPNPDLKFINNTSAKILIQARIEGTKLYFTFYGTDDGRKVELDGPYVTEKNDKNQMKTILYQKVFKTDGSELINDTFRSFYDDPAKYHHETTSSLLTEKPKNWSKNEWNDYKKANGL